MLLAGTSGLLTAPALVRAQGTNGVALVIGNSKYKWEASLPNVRRDAPDIARAFQELGLKTELLQDASRDAMSAAVEKFKSAASGANLAALYFAGHGASWDKDTYLVPVDTDLGSPDVVRTLLPVTAISAAIRGASHRLLVFDNCRNNPADGWRQRAASEQARVAASELAAAAVHGPNTLVLFSTAPGCVALDGPAGDNSPFAAAFLRQLRNSRIDLSALAALVRRDLLIATEGRQVAWDESTYTVPFVLNGPTGRQADGRRSHVVELSRIVELPNAYAFAREKKLRLPQGLIAIRSQSGSPHSQKVGAFEGTTKSYTAPNSTLGTSIEPIVLIVVSVPDSDSAQIVFAFRDFQRAEGVVWRFMTGRFSQGELALSFATMSGSGETSYLFKWRDLNSGSHTYYSTGSGGGRFSSRFTRLDG